MSECRLSEALEVRVRQLLTHVRRAERGDVDGVHRARVASRRLREALPIAARGGRSAIRSRERRAVRRLTRALGAVRELDVTTAELTATARRYGWDGSAVARVVDRLADARAQAMEALVATIARPSVTAMFATLRRTCRSSRAQRSSRGPLGPGASAGGDAWMKPLTVRRVRRATVLADRLRTLSTLYVPDQLHAVRIAGKKLRYCLELERALHRVAVARDLRDLEAMQDDLGRLHDLQVLQALLHDASRGAEGRRGKSNEFQPMIRDVERECRLLHAHVVAHTPRWARVPERVLRRR